MEVVNSLFNLRVTAAFIMHIYIFSEWGFSVIGVSVVGDPPSKSGWKFHSGLRLFGICVEAWVCPCPGVISLVGPSIPRTVTVRDYVVGRLDSKAATSSGASLNSFMPCVIPYVIASWCIREVSD